MHLTTTILLFTLITLSNSSPTPKPKPSLDHYPRSFPQAERKLRASCSNWRGGLSLELQNKISNFAMDLTKLYYNTNKAKVEWNAVYRLNELLVCGSENLIYVNFEPGFKVKDKSNTTPTVSAYSFTATTTPTGNRDQCVMLASMKLVKDKKGGVRRVVSFREAHCFMLEEHYFLIRTNGHVMG